MRLFRLLTCSVLAAAALVAAPASAAPRIWPAWSIEGNYAVDLPTGFKSLAGTFTFPFAGGAASLTVEYDDKGRLVGHGVADVPDGGGGSISSLYSLAGTFAVDAAGVQTVHFADAPRSPRFTFDGAVSADALTIVGAYARLEGFLGLAGDDEGPVTMTRTTADAVPSKFVLSFEARMDVKGRVRGGVAQDGKHETLASVTLFGTRPAPMNQRVPWKLEGGKVRGQVKTDKFGVTTATLTIVGPKWSAKFTGPVEGTGYHARCDFVGAGFSIKGLQLTLAVRAGPTPPTPPPPPVTKPPYLLEGAQAVISNGAVTLTHSAVSKKFFGATAGLTVRFPMPGGTATLPVVVHADPSTTALPEPDPRRFIATVGAATYTAANPGADVTLDIRKLSSSPGGTIEVFATGTVVAANGKKRTVYVLIDATVQ